jgi:ATP-binding cassette, subfamily C (CFTR/MRP), member 1
LATLIAAVQILLLVLWVLHQKQATKATLPSAILNLVVSVTLPVISWAEDALSLRPSTLLASYLSSTAVLDLAQARTLWLAWEVPLLPSTFSASIGLKILLLVLELQSKRSSFLPQHKSLPTESTSGIVNRSLLWWTTGLLKQGYRGQIELESLPPVDHELRSELLGEKMRQAWDARLRPERRLEFMWASLFALWWPCCQAMAPRLAMIGFSYAQPFLISAALAMLSAPWDDTMEAKSSGLLAATVLVYVGIAISKQFSDHRLSRVVTMVRGMTVSLVHDHALQVQSGPHDLATTITLMSTDAEAMAESITRLHEILARAVEIPIGLYLLARHLGWACGKLTIEPFSSRIFSVLDPHMDEQRQSLSVADSL